MFFVVIDYVLRNSNKKDNESWIKGVDLWQILHDANLNNKDFDWPKLSNTLWMLNSSSRACILNSAPSFPLGNKLKLITLVEIHYPSQHPHSSQMHNFYGRCVAVPNASTLFMVWHYKSKCIIYGPKLMHYLPCAVCFQEIQSQIAACQNYGAIPFRAERPQQPWFMTVN